MNYSNKETLSPKELFAIPKNTVTIRVIRTKKVSNDRNYLRQESVAVTRNEATTIGSNTYNL